MRRVCADVLLRIHGAPIVIHAVVQLSRIAVFRRALVETLKHVVEVRRVVRVGQREGLLCFVGVVRTEVFRHRHALGNDLGVDAVDIPAVEPVRLGSVKRPVFCGRPLLLDVLLKLCREAAEQLARAEPAPVDVEVHRVAVAAEIHVHDRAAVAGCHNVRIRLFEGEEAGLASEVRRALLRVGKRDGASGQRVCGHALFKEVFVRVVHGLVPVYERKGRVCGRPCGRERNAARYRVRRVLPAGEHIAAAHGRRERKIRKGCAVLDIDRIHGIAAVRVKGQPVALARIVEADDRVAAQRDMLRLRLCEALVGLLRLDGALFTVQAGLRLRGGRVRFINAVRERFPAVFHRIGHCGGRVGHGLGVVAVDRIKRKMNLRFVRRIAGDHGRFDREIDGMPLAVARDGRRCGGRTVHIAVNDAQGADVELFILRGHDKVRLHVVEVPVPADEAVALARGHIRLDRGVPAWNGLRRTEQRAVPVKEFDRKFRGRGRRGRFRVCGGNRLRALSQRSHGEERQQHCKSEHKAKRPFPMRTYRVIHCTYPHFYFY